MTSILDFKYPGVGWKGLEFYFYQTPLLITKLVWYSLTFPFYWMKYRNVKVTDSDIFNLCTKSSLVLFVNQSHAGYVYKVIPTLSPKFSPVGGICDPSSLEVRFSMCGKRILYARSSMGDVFGENDIILSSMQNILMTWVHTCVHVAAEKCALQIEHDKVEPLYPSARFVSALHEGLLTSTFSPAGPNSPFFCLGSSNGNKVVEDVRAFPIPVHSTPQPPYKLPYYRFLLESRKAIFDVVREQKLKVDPESLFLLLVVHGVDHSSTFQQLRKISFVSIDGSGSLYSRWQFYCFTYMWTQYWDNLLNSQRLESNTHSPFYKSVWDRLQVIDKMETKRVVISCCF